MTTTPTPTTPTRSYEDDDIRNLAESIGDLFEAFWLALRNGLEDLADFWMGVLYALITFCMDVFGGLLMVALAILPDVDVLPSPPTGGAFGLIASANTFVPIEEAFTALTFLGAVWGARGLYLLARFIRGGG